MQKKKKTETNIFIYANFFSLIAVPIIEDDPMDSAVINTVINENCLKINELTDYLALDCKSSIKGSHFKHTTPIPIKQLSNTPRTYVSFHQSKEKKVYQVVIRNLHPINYTTFIKKKLLHKGFSIINILPVIQSTKVFYRFSLLHQTKSY